MKTNRPWTQSITRTLGIARESGITEQVHKLARNYIASLDLGYPGLQLVNEVDNGVFTAKMSGRERYLQWVKGWKHLYAELSNLIHHTKKNRKNGGGIGQEQDLWRLKETARVMLNARYNAKAASYAIVMRKRAEEERKNSK